MTRPTVAEAFHFYKLRRWPVVTRNDNSREVPGGNWRCLGIGEGNLDPARFWTSVDSPG